MSVLDFAQEYNGALLVFLTFGMLMSGIASFLVAVFLAQENRILRKAGTEPEVVGYLMPDERSPNVLRFHIKNVGNGPAMNVAFRLTGDHERYRSFDLKLPVEIERPPLSVLPQDEKLSLFFGLAYKLLQEPQLGPVNVSITYENALGRKYRKDVTLDVAQFKGFRWSGRQADHDIADSLKKIMEEIIRWGNGHRKLHVVSDTPEGWREESEKLFKAWEDDDAGSNS